MKILKPNKINFTTIRLPFQKYVDIEKVLVSNKLVSRLVIRFLLIKKTGYLYDYHKVKALRIKLPKASA